MRRRQALADQHLGERHHRALAQVVGAVLEAEAEQADALLSGLDDLRRTRARPAVGCSAGSTTAPASRDRAPWRGTASRARPSAGTIRRTRSQASGNTARYSASSSRQKMSISSWLSTSTRLQRLPISFAKHTFSACQHVARVLHHLGDADARVDERRVDRRDRAPSVCVASIAWLWPTSVSGGF